MVKLTTFALLMRFPRYVIHTTIYKLASFILVAFSFKTLYVHLIQRKAVEKVKARGGIVKQDPNSVKKNLSTPEAQERICKRLRTSKPILFSFMIPEFRALSNH
jgi:hypothetical protein